MRRGANHTCASAVRKLQVLVSQHPAGVYDLHDRTGVKRATETVTVRTRDRSSSGEERGANARWASGSISQTYPERGRSCYAYRLLRAGAGLPSYFCCRMAFSSAMVLSSGTLMLQSARWLCGFLNEQRDLLLC